MPSGPTQSFDLVMSNPPYYPRPPRHIQLHSVANRANQLKSNGCTNVEATDEALWSQSRAHARFREYLPPLDLLRGVAALLAPNGAFWCVYPASQEKILLRAAQAAGLQQRNRLAVVFKTGLPVERVIWSFEHGSPAPSRLGGGAADAPSAHKSMAGSPVDKLLVVRHDDKTYTKDFASLTQMCYGKVLPTTE